MEFRPLHDRVLLRRTEQEEKTSGGIIIPDTAQEKPMEGEIVATGPGGRGDDGKLVPMDVNTPKMKTTTIISTSVYPRLFAKRAFALSLNSGTPDLFLAIFTRNSESARSTAGTWRGALRLSHNRMPS